MGFFVFVFCFSLSSLFPPEHYIKSCLAMTSFPLFVFNSLFCYFVAYDSNICDETKCLASPAHVEVPLGSILNPSVCVLDSYGTRNWEEA